MASIDIARTAVGIVGNVISFIMFLAPVPTFWKIYKWKSTKGFSGVPYVVTLLNCFLWIYYGLPIVTHHNILVSTTNGVGASFEIIYIILFITYANSKARKGVTLILLGETIAFAVVVILAELVTVHEKARTFLVGICCVILNIGMYAAPLTIMRQVIRTRTAKYLPIHLSWMLFINGCIWTTYAVLRFDIFVVIPNALGAAFGIAQLALYFIYGNEDEEEVEKNQAASKTTDLEMAGNLRL